MVEKFKGLFVEEDGQGMVEYGLILGAIAVVVIIALFALGDEISDLFDKVTGDLTERTTE